jgi:hypothetical protein
MIAPNGSGMSQGKPWRVKESWPHAPASALCVDATYSNVAASVRTTISPPNIHRRRRCTLLGSGLPGLPKFSAVRTSHLPRPKHIYLTAAPAQPDSGIMDARVVTVRMRMRAVLSPAIVSTLPNPPGPSPLVVGRCPSVPFSVVFTASFFPFDGPGWAVVHFERWERAALAVHSWRRGQVARQGSAKP